MILILVKKVINDEHPFPRKPRKTNFKQKISLYISANFLDHSVVPPFPFYLTDAQISF